MSKLQGLKVLRERLREIAGYIPGVLIVGYALGALIWFMVGVLRPVPPDIQATRDAAAAWEAERSRDHPRTPVTRREGY